MKEPKRWIETESGSTPLERELLLPALNVQVPPGMEDQIWAGLAAAVPLAAGATVLAGQAAAAPGLGTALKLPLAAVLKAFAVGAASGALVTGGLTAIEPEQRDSASAPAAIATVAPRPAPRPRAAAAPQPSAAPVEREEAVVDPPRERAEPARARPRPDRAAETPRAIAPDPPEAAPASRLRAEAATLRRARQALKSGDLGGASEALEVARTEFGRGALGEEREALAIELLARSGQREAARARAAQFLQSFPNSAHAARVRSFL